MPQRCCWVHSSLNRMYIQANLHALEQRLDLFVREENAAASLLRLLEEKNNILPGQMQDYEEHRYFLNDMIRKIRLRSQFMQDTLDELRRAEIRLAEALQTASDNLSSDQ